MLITGSFKAALAVLARVSGCFWHGVFVFRNLISGILRPIMRTTLEGHLVIPEEMRTFFLRTTEHR